MVFLKIPVNANYCRWVFAQTVTYIKFCLCTFNSWHIVTFLLLCNDIRKYIQILQHLMLGCVPTVDYIVGSDMMMNEDDFYSLVGE